VSDGVVDDLCDVYNGDGMRWMAAGPVQNVWNVWNVFDLRTSACLGISNVWNL